MKNFKLSIFFSLALICLVPLFSLYIPSADIMGGWSQQVETVRGKEQHILLFSNQYFSWTVYFADTGAFVSTKGGSWSLENNKLTLNYEFNTDDTSTVGTTEMIKVALKNNTLELKGQLAAWQSIDQGKSTPINGSWLISGRKRNGELRKTNTDRPRKTMKILTGSRFQWIAYNVETKAFSGTGGGSYTAENGKYTENIEFFSRDNSRVGASLQFDFEVKDGDWIHSGKSSKGTPLYEIWSKRVK